MGLGEAYAEKIHDEWEDVHANWPVSFNRNLGDYGTLEDGIFRKHGNITTDFEISFQQNDDPNDAIIEYNSSKKVEVNFIAKSDFSTSGIQLANGGIELKFGSKEAFYFRATRGKWLHIDSPYKIGQKILEIYEKPHDLKWQRDFVVITELLAAEATTVISSQSSNSSLTIEAQAGELPSCVCWMLKQNFLSKVKVMLG